MGSLENCEFSKLINTDSNKKMNPLTPPRLDRHDIRCPPLQICVPMRECDINYKFAPGKSSWYVRGGVTAFYDVFKDFVWRDGKRPITITISTTGQSRIIKYPPHGLFLLMAGASFYANFTITWTGDHTPESVIYLITSRINRDLFSKTPLRVEYEHANGKPNFLYYHGGGLVAFKNNQLPAVEYVELSIRCVTYTAFCDEYKRYYASVMSTPLTHDEIRLVVSYSMPAHPFFITQGDAKEYVEFQIKSINTESMSLLRLSIAIHNRGDVWDWDCNKICELLASPQQPYGALWKLVKPLANAD